MVLLAYLQPALFYLIPMSIGRALRMLITAIIFPQTLTIVESIRSVLTRKSIELRSTTAIQLLLRLGSDFLIGGLFLFVLAFVMKFFTNWFGLSFSALYFPTTYLLFILSLFINVWKAPYIPMIEIKPLIGISLIALFFSIISSSMWQANTPYPLNWDFYQHQTLSTLILQQDIFHFYTSDMSDMFGFNSYPPFFHILLAISQYGSSLSPDYITRFWLHISFLHLLTASIVSYLFGYAVTQRKMVGVLSCLVGTLAFDSVISFTNLFFLPQTVCAVFFVWGFSRIIWKSAQLQHISFTELLLTSIALVCMHYVIGPLAVAILILAFIYFKFDYHSAQLIEHLPIIQFGILVAIVAVVLSQFIDLSFLNNGEGELYVFSLMEKVTFAQRIYGFSLLFILPIGLAASYQFPTKQMKLSLLVTLGLVCILVSQFPYVLKFYVLARFFIHMLLAVGLWGLIKTMRFRASQLVALSCIGIMWMGILQANIAFWKQGLFDGEEIAHINQDDLAAAQFLQSYDRTHTAMLVSDPSTQFLMEGLSGVNSPGGVYATVEQREAIFRVFSLPSDQETKTQLYSVFDRLEPQPSTRLLVVSGRTFIWHHSSPEDRQSFNLNIWAPKTLSFSDLTAIQRLQEQFPSFSLVYKNPSYAIFELKK